MTRTPLRSIIIIIVILLALFFGYRWLKEHHAGGQAAAGGAPPVSVAEVVARDVQQWNDFSGQLVAVNQVEIRPRVTGTIDSVHFEEGAVVHKGDLLFVIDPRPFQAAKDQAEAALVSAEAQVGLAHTERDRAERLMKDKAIPQREFDERNNTLKVAEASIQGAKAALETAKLNLEYCYIRAPITGRASRAEITEGNLVQTGVNAPLLTTVVTSNPIYADFDVDEQNFLNYVQESAVGNDAAKKIPVTISLANDGNVTRKGVISSFDNRLDRASGTIRVRALFDNKDGALVPGLFARVELGEAGAKHVLLISERAIGTDQSKKFVMVVGDDNKANYREVKLGGMADGMRVVKDGLKPGEKIIVNGLQHARPGAPVTPELVAMDAKESSKADDLSKK